MITALPSSSRVYSKSRSESDSILVGASMVSVGSALSAGGSVSSHAVKDARIFVRLDKKKRS